MFGQVIPLTVLASNVGKSALSALSTLSALSEQSAMSALSEMSAMSYGSRQIPLRFLSMHLEDRRMDLPNLLLAVGSTTDNVAPLKFHQRGPYFFFLAMAVDLSVSVSA